MLEHLQAKADESEKEWTARWHATLGENEGLCAEVRALEKERDEILEALKRTYTLLPPERVHLATEGTAILVALAEEEKEP